MIIAVLFLVLGFALCGLAPLGLMLGGLLWLWIQVFPADLSPLSPLAIAAFAIAVPLTAMSTVLLIERMGEFVTPLPSLRAAAALASATVLVSQSAWIDLVIGIEHVVVENPRWSQGILPMSVLGIGLGSSVVFSAVMTVLSLTVVQYLLQCGVSIGLRGARAEVALPWSAVRVFGALVLVALFSQYIALFIGQQLAPQSVLSVAGK